MTTVLQSMGLIQKGHTLIQTMVLTRMCVCVCVRAGEWSMLRGSQAQTCHNHGRRKERVATACR